MWSRTRSETGVAGVQREVTTEIVRRLVISVRQGLVTSPVVYRALIGHGVPIDATGGTSIGSLIAGGVAPGQSPEEIARQRRDAVFEQSPFDVTLPAVSLASGRRVTQRIKAGADGLDLEDGWRRVFAVSTNLTTGRAEIHRTGPGWQAIRANFSIPGVFPPVRTAADELLVDGGLLDNLPVGVMRASTRGSP
ncbi:MAG: patatin-like phospholipase family protein [Acidimicrobiia bacterium]|nr:patatin-like phospholipase family protein [Acidimicrobiia bacterium]